MHFLKEKTIFPDITFLVSLQCLLFCFGNRDLVLIPSYIFSFHIYCSEFLEFIRALRISCLSFGKQIMNSLMENLPYNK